MAFKVSGRAVVDIAGCVACGTCVNGLCPKDAIYIRSGVHAAVREELCIGCGLCVGSCPASVIALEEISA